MIKGKTKDGRPIDSEFGPKPHDHEGRRVWVRKVLDRDLSPERLVITCKEVIF